MKQTLLAILLTFLSIVANADVVEIDGIYYNLSPNEKVAEVTRNPNKYTGVVSIPKTVKYNSVDYDVTSIGNYAFNGCSGLTSVTIPISVTSIGIWAFYGCSGLTSVTIPNSVTSIGDGSFRGCRGLIQMIIPSSVTNIGNSAFQECSGLKSVSIPQSVMSIGDQAFHACSGLTSIVIPNLVTRIGKYTFCLCRDLTSISIPSSVTNIEIYAFDGCHEITDLYCYAENVPSSQTDLFNNTSIENATLHVPASAIDKYKANYLWNRFKNIVALEELTPPTQETTKCATPIISYADGKLTFNCATEGVEYVSEVSVADAKKYYDAEVPLLGVYHVTVYATKTGYDNSDVATADFVIKGSTVTLVGDVNNDGKVDATDITRLIDILLKRTN